MAAAGDPMVELLFQMATLAASNVAIQGQVATLQSGAQAAASTSFARTPAFMGQTDLLDFRKKADLSVYAKARARGLRETNVLTSRRRH